MAKANSSERDGDTLAAEMLEAFDSFKGEYPAMQKSLKEVVEMITPLKGMDTKKLLDDVERIRAGQQAMVKQIRNNRTGIYVPGLEDEKEAEKFSVCRAAWAVKTGKWDNAKHEEAVLKEYEPKLKNVVGVESQGGAFIPDQIIADVIGAIYTRSVLISLQGEGTTRLSVIDGLFGGEVRIPKFKGGMLAYWLGEMDEYVESTTKLGDITMTPKKLTLLTRMSEEMRKWGGFGFENLLRTDMARAAAKKLDWTALYGTGNENMPRGVVAQKGVGWFCAETGQFVSASPSDSQGGDMTFDHVSEMYGHLEDQDVEADDTAALISAPRFFRKLKQRKVDYYSGQTTNQGYLLGGPSLTDDRLAEYIGDFDKTTQIPTTNLPGQTLGWTTTSTTAKFGDTFLGNWGEMVMGRWGAIELLSDNGTGPGFMRDQIYIKMRLYVDFAIRHAQSFAICPDARMRA